MLEGQAFPRINGIFSFIGAFPIHLNFETFVLLTQHSSWNSCTITEVMLLVDQLLHGAYDSTNNKSGSYRNCFPTKMQLLPHRASNFPTGNYNQFNYYCVFN